MFFILFFYWVLLGGQFRLLIEVAVLLEDTVEEGG